MKPIRGHTVGSVQGSRTVSLKHVCKKCGYSDETAKPETLLTEEEWVVWLGRKRPNLFSQLVRGGWG
jgi:hypothetical protein